jgi:hypothetical protein
MVYFLIHPFRGQVAVGIEPDRIALKNGNSWQVRKSDPISFVDYKGATLFYALVSSVVVSALLPSLLLFVMNIFVLDFDFGKAAFHFAYMFGAFFLINSLWAAIRNIDMIQRIIYFFPAGKTGYLRLEIPPPEADLLPERLQQLGLAVKQLPAEINPLKWRKMLQAGVKS